MMLLEMVVRLDKHKVECHVSWCGRILTPLQDFSLIVLVLNGAILYLKQGWVFIRALLIVLGHLHYLFQLSTLHSFARLHLWFQGTLRKSCRGTAADVNYTLDVRNILKTCSYPYTQVESFSPAAVLAAPQRIQNMLHSTPTQIPPCLLVSPFTSGFQGRRRAHTPAPDDRDVFQWSPLPCCACTGPSSPVSYLKHW